MNIIFGENNLQKVDSKYTVLELDTFVTPSGSLTSAYCLLENVPIVNLPRVDEMKNLHNNFLLNYRKKDWNYCSQALDHLTGFWGNEMDTFYDTMRRRINEYTNNDPGPDWDGSVKMRTPT